MCVCYGGVGLGGSVYIQTGVCVCVCIHTLRYILHVEAIKMNLSSLRIPRDGSDPRSLTSMPVHQFHNP